MSKTLIGSGIQVSPHLASADGFLQTPLLDRRGGGVFADGVVDPAVRKTS
jgi:hypothetical protein